MIDLLTPLARETWILLNEAAPWVLLGFTVAALIKAFVSDAFVARHLGGSGPGSVLRASLIGVPLPLCSCGVVPAAFGLRRQGAGKGATTAFLISTPETGADSIAVTWALLDPLMTVLRPVAAFVTAMVAGLAVNALPDETPDGPRQDAEPTGCGCSSCGCNGAAPAPTANPGLRQRLRAGFSHAFGEMLADIGKWLFIGLLLAGAIAAYVPEPVFTRWLGNEWISLIAMLVVGVPLYVCATSSTPIAAALALKGLSPGAALVFLLAGPATNAATIGVVAGSLGKRAAVAYTASIAVCSLALGWAVNRVYFALGLDIGSWVATTEAEAVTWFSAACAVALVALTAWAMIPGPGRNEHHGAGGGPGSPAIGGDQFKIR